MSMADRACCKSEGSDTVRDDGVTACDRHVAAILHRANLLVLPVAKAKSSGAHQEQSSTAKYMFR
jgi:hypothetical protein